MFDVCDKNDFFRNSVLLLIILYPLQKSTFYYLIFA